jgi:hypothetical protein
VSAASENCTGRARGRVRLWVPLLLLAGGTIWALERLAGPVEAAEFTRVDLRRARLDPPPGAFCDPRWSEQLAATLASCPAPDVHDAAGLERVAQQVAALPFVARTGEVHVVWPDGLEVPLRLRQPVACVRSAAGFLLVSEEGVLLPGSWPTPPQIEGRPLPVIGPNDGAFERAVAGTKLAQQRHLDALAVALSMRRDLPAADAQTLGPLLIDASRSAATSVDEPGTLLELEGPRLVLFGRAPGSGQPGELPDELKWRSLARAAALLRGEGADAPSDWALVDVRWDTPALRLRSEEPKARHPLPPPPVAVAKTRPAPAPSNGPVVR